MDNGESAYVSTDDITFSSNHHNEVRYAAPEDSGDSSLSMAISGRRRTFQVPFVFRDDGPSPYRIVETSTGVRSAMHTYQTARAEPNNTEIHFPEQESIHFSYPIRDPLEGFAGSGSRSMHYRTRSLNIPRNTPVLVNYTVTEVRGETATIHNVLAVPNCPGYENIASPFLNDRDTDVEQVLQLVERIQYVPVTYPEYRDRMAREQSFQSWPRLTPTVAALVAAGMFYTGAYMAEDGVYVDDSVVCYKCGMRMGSFSNRDDPAEEHMRIHPSCSEINWQ